MRKLREVFDVARAVQQRFGQVNGGVLAGSITLALFLSLFPLLLLAGAVLGWVAAGGRDIAGEIISGLGLTGEAATTVRETVSSASRTRQAATVVGLAGLAWSALGVVGAIQTGLNNVWQRPGRGWKAKLVAAGWLVSTGIGVAAALMITRLAFAVLPAWAAPFGVISTLALYTVVFWWTFRALCSAPVGWRAHLPGAVAAAIGNLVLSVVGTVWLPRAVASSSSLYGSLGVVFALIAWLFFFGRLLVYACVLNVVVYERRAGTVTVELEAPRVPGEVPINAGRSGQVELV